MDCETVKILMLKKILNVFVPKIFAYNTILNGPNTYAWQPNFYFLSEHQRPSDYSGISINIVVNRHSDGSDLKIDFTKTIQREALQPLAARRGGVFPFFAGAAAGNAEEENRIERINLSFNKIESAITAIIKHLDVKDITRIALCAMSEVHSHENPENMSVGTIKKILDIHTDVDLLNLETRRVLLERIT